MFVNIHVRVLKIKKRFRIINLKDLFLILFFNIIIKSVTAAIET